MPDDTEPSAAELAAEVAFRLALDSGDPVRIEQTAAIVDLLDATWQRELARRAEHEDPA